MAVPKSKVSSQRKNKRRSSVWKLKSPQIAACPKCGEYNLTHRVCSNCGSYDGKEVIKQG